MHPCLIAPDWACRFVPCQHQWCSNMPSLTGNHGAWCAVGPLICSAYFTMCSSTGLLRAVAGSTRALVPGRYSVIVCSMNKTQLWSTLRGVPNNTSASLPGLCMGDASIFMGDGTSKFCNNVQACWYEAWQRDPTDGQATWDWGRDLHAPCVCMGPFGKRSGDKPPCWQPMKGRLPGYG